MKKVTRVIFFQSDPQLAQTTTGESENGSVVFVLYFKAVVIS